MQPLTKGSHLILSYPLRGSASCACPLAVSDFCACVCVLSACVCPLCVCVCVCVWWLAHLTSWLSWRSRRCRFSSSCSMGLSSGNSYGAVRISLSVRPRENSSCEEETHTHISHTITHAHTFMAVAL